MIASSLVERSTDCRWRVVTHDDPPESRTPRDRLERRPCLDGSTASLSTGQYCDAGLRLIAARRTAEIGWLTMPPGRKRQVLITTGHFDIDGFCR